MYMTLAAWMLIALFMISWFWHGFYVLLFVAFIYFGLLYLRADDITGYATYDWLRRLGLWQRLSPVQILMGNEDAFIGARRPRPHIFVVRR